MHLKRTCAMAAILVTGFVRAADVPKLPSDFFLPQMGKLEDTIEVKQTSEKEFQLRQHLGGRPLPRDSGTLLNFMAFCAAYGLSTSKGYSGWSLTMKPSTGDMPVERFLVVLLSNGPDDLKDVTSPKDWTGYIDNAKIRDATCKRLVNPQYLK